MALLRTIPALPVRDTAAAAAYYADRLGFTVAHLEDDFVRLVREEAEIHLWGASDGAWSQRQDFVQRPVRSGAEDFLAGTASCRIGADDVDALHAELTAAGARLHPTDTGAPVTSSWSTREFHVLDVDGNLLTFYTHVGG